MENKVKKDNEMKRKYANILGIRVNSTPLDELLTAVENNISHNRRFYIVTPNPELVLMAQKDQVLKKALNSTDFSIPDGIGLSQAARFLSMISPKNRVVRFIVSLVQGLIVGVSTFFAPGWLTKEVKPLKGRLLFMELMKLANKYGWRVFFLGGKNDEASISAKKISAKYKNLKIQAVAGPMFDNNGNPRSESDSKIYIDIVKRVNKFNPQLLIVGLTDPKEEKFVFKNYRKLNIGGAAAFGGTFRYVAGMSKLPPKWIGQIGLEWVWRLFTEPQRIGRILNAFPVFPLKVFWYKVTN